MAGVFYAGDRRGTGGVRKDTGKGQECLRKEDEILFEKYGQTVIEDIASLKSLKRALEEGGFETLQRRSCANNRTRGLKL